MRTKLLAAAVLLACSLMAARADIPGLTKGTPDVKSVSAQIGRAHV